MNPPAFTSCNVFHPVEPNMGLAGLVACLIKQADWWEHSCGHMAFVPIIPKSYPAKRDVAANAHRIAVAQIRRVA